MGNIQEMLGSLDLESQRGGSPVELGPKFLSSGYHLADDHTPETQKRALTKLISDSGECVLVIALLLHRGPLPGTETGSFCLWAGWAKRDNTDKVSKQTGNEKEYVRLFSFGFAGSFYCLLLAEPKGKPAGEE